MSRKFRRQEFGGEDHCQYLLDLFTMQKYDNELPKSLINEGFPNFGTAIWKSEPIIDPWERLLYAVIAQACADWIDGNDRIRFEIEEFFQMNGISEAVLEELTFRMRFSQSDRYRRFLKAQISHVK